MQLKEIFEKRRSVRAFTADKIDDELIEDMLYSASLAPETDSCRYYFGVIRDDKVKKQIADATCYARWVQGAPVIFVCCADISWDLKDQSDDSYGVTGMAMRYGENIVSYLRQSKERKACKALMLSSPVYIAAQHIILSAVSHGLRGCLVDFIDLEKINEILGLPENITCQLLVPVGYAEKIPKPKSPRDGKTFFYEGWGG